MLVYVIGHKGWIGGLFINALKADGNEVMFSDYRAESPEIKKDILHKKPSHVLYCAGRTTGGHYKSIDYLQEPSTFKENINDNLYGPLSIAMMCDMYKIHFTYIGSGCIYTYDEEHSVENRKGFKETDRPNFFGSNYSIVKGYTDLLLQQTNALSLRVRMPIVKDMHPKNFVTKLLSYNKIHSVLNSMTELDDMIPVAVKMMRNSETGTYNFTNIDTTHADLLKAYPEHKWESVEYNEIGTKAARSNALLDNSKLKEKYL